MNFLGRILLLLLTILVIAVLTVFLLSPTTIGNWSGNISEISPVLRVIVAVLLDLVLLVLLFTQFRAARQPESTGLMMRATGTVTEVSVESARDRILKAISDVPDVVSVDAQVQPVRGRADIELDVEVLGEDVRLPDKQKDIDRALKQVINKQLGLHMAGRPRVHIRLHREKPIVRTPVPKEIPTVAAPLPEIERREPVSTPLVLERISESEEEALTVRPPAPPEPVVVETKPEPREGLFSGLFRSRDREEPASPAEPAKPHPDDEELFADTPELAALLKSTPEEEKPAEPVPLVVETVSEVEAEADELDTLHLDKDVADPAADDLAEKLPGDKPNDEEAHMSSDDEEKDEPRQA